MKILILGGTGAMGSHLSDILSGRGDEVCVTSRAAHAAHGNVAYVRGDAHDGAFLEPLLACRRWDAVVDFMVYSTVEFRRRVRLLLDATAQYVFLSSARVYAGSPAPITETSPRLLDVCRDVEYLSTDEYALAKARQEDMLRASGRAGWTIVRPYITYGEARLQLGVLEKESWLARALRGRTIVFSRDIAERSTTLTYGRDVARGIAALIGDGRAFGEAFNVTCGRSIRWGEVADIYAEVVGRKTGRRPEVLLADTHPLTMTAQVRYDRYYDRTFDESKMDGFIDTAGFADPREGLRLCLGRFLEDPAFGRACVRTEAAFDRLAGERTPLSSFAGLRRKAAYLLFRHCPAVARGLDGARRKAGNWRI